MLKIHLPLSLRGRFSGPVARLFEQMSAPTFPKMVGSYPPSILPLVEVLARGSRTDAFQFCPGRELAPGEYQPLLRPLDVMVAFTGGKDSTATAIRLRKAGLRPTLFHVQGINPAFSHEARAAKEVAERLSMPILWAQVKLEGTSPHIENPIKNQMILALQVEAGLERGIHQFAQGNMKADSAERQSWNAGFSDCIEMYQAAERFFRAHIPDFKLHIGVMEDETESLKLVAEEAPEVLPFISSCMTPPRFKPTTRAANERKFGPLLPGRCGSCYKCCQEALVLGSLGKMPLTKEQVVHSLQKIRMALPMIFGDPDSSNWPLAKVAETFLDRKHIPINAILSYLV